MESKQVLRDIARRLSIAGTARRESSPAAPFATPRSRVLHRAALAFASCLVAACAGAPVEEESTDPLDDVVVMGSGYDEEADERAVQDILWMEMLDLSGDYTEVRDELAESEEHIAAMQPLESAGTTALENDLIASEAAREALEAQVQELRILLAEEIDAGDGESTALDFSTLRIEADGGIPNVYYVMDARNTLLARVRFDLPAGEQTSAAKRLEGGVNWKWLPDNSVSAELTRTSAVLPMLELRVALEGLAQWEKVLDFSDFQSGANEPWALDISNMKGSRNLSYSLRFLHPALLPNGYVQTGAASMPVTKRTWYHQTSLDAANAIGASLISFIVVLLTTLTGGFVALRGLWVKVTKALGAEAAAGEGA